MKSAVLLVLSVCLLLAAPAEGRKRKPASESGGDDSISLRKILEAEDQRLAKDKLLLRAISHPNRKISKAAMLAVARIQDPAAIEELTKLLNKKDKELKGMAAFALGIISGDLSVKILQQHLQMYKDPEILAPLLVALGRAGTEPQVAQLGSFITDTADSRVVEAAAYGLGILWSGPSEKWSVPPQLIPRLIRWSTKDTSTALYTAFAVARYKGDLSTVPIAELSDAAAKAPLVYARAYLVRALGKLKSPQVRPVLLKEVKTSPHLGIVVEGLKALANQDFNADVAAAISGAFSHPNSGVVYTALETAGSFGVSAASLTPQLDNVLASKASTWIRSTAIKNYAKVSPTLARDKIDAILKGPSLDLLPAAVHGLGLMGSSADYEKIAPYIRSDKPEDTKIAVEAIDALTYQTDDNFTASVKPALKSALEKVDIAIASLVSQLVEKFKWKDFAPTLANVYPLFTQRDQVEAKVAILGALASAGSYAQTEVIQAALTDPDKVVVTAAVRALKEITGKDESAKIPLNSKPSLPTPLAGDIASAVNRRVVIVTNRGEIHARMLEIAPLSSSNFIRLAKDGFYNKKTFHRVVPNFVIQGGDPRGDGYGGPGYLLRDEISPVRHSRGTLGMATAGKDTGGCQFFINLAPNPHLDGRYTVFAEVTKGMEVADKIEVGDQILKIKIQ